MSTALAVPDQYRTAGRAAASAEVHLPDGTDPAAPFAAWLAAVKGKLHQCPHHPRTRMPFVEGAASFSTLPCWQQQLSVLSPEDATGWAKRMMADACFEQPTPPPTHRFCAHFTCPACVVGRARFPREFHETSFADFETSTPERAAALKRCRDFLAQVAQHQRGFLVMVGRCGTGKTRLAANIVRELPQLPALYCRQQEATNELRSSYGHREITYRRFASARSEDHDDRDTPAPSPVLTRLQSAKLLILDELFCVAQGKDEVALLDEVLKHRFDRGLPTILISNLPFNAFGTTPGFKDSLGDALTSRIALATGDWRFHVSLAGPDFRVSRGLDYLRPKEPSPAALD